MPALTLTLLSHEAPLPGLEASNEELEVVASKSIDASETLSLEKITRSSFATHLPALGHIAGFKFFLAVESTNQPRIWSDLKPIWLAENAHGLLHCHLFSNSSMTMREFSRTDTAGYFRGASPDIIYAAPIYRGIGGFEFIGDLPSALFWLGVGWIATDVLPSPVEMLRTKNLTSRARLLIQDFQERGIHSLETLRVWAETRDVWTTYEGAKKLGVDHETMASIFHALGYQLRSEDQTWRLGLTEEHRVRREAWIAGEPSRQRIIQKESMEEYIVASKSFNPED